MAVRSQQLLERGEPRPETPRRGAVDTALLLIILMLLATGLIALFTASYSAALNSKGNGLYYITRQGIFAVLGLCLMWLVSGLNYHVYGALHKPIFAGALVLLVLVKIIGSTGGGATRWIMVAGISIQPSEIMKIAMIFVFAYYIAREPKSVRTLRGLIWPYGGILGLVVGILVLQPHASAALIICGICFVMLYVGGMKMWYFVPIGVVAVPAGFIAVTKLEVLAHVRDRLNIWFNPFSDIRGDGWQGAMSQIAIGTGGPWGMGLGQGRQKHLYLPEPQNDFVFAAFSEELGFVGSVLVLLLFAYLIFRGFYIARSAKDKFGCLVATGITAKLAIQTLLNLWVITGLAPVTGASLPMFSYGGSALVMQLFELGVLLNISRSMTVDSTE